MGGMNKRVGSIFKKKRVESENFVRNGGELMEKLISLSNGRPEIQIKRFTIQEITKFTNNFAELFKDCYDFKLFKGNLEGRPILVQIWAWKFYIYDDHRGVAFPTAISALMSHLKYTLKLIGCCTDFELPAQVYEYAGTATLYDLLGEDQAVPLSWVHRLKIARDVAAMLLYLHTSFPVAIIHREMKPENVLIDQNGDAKLFNFSSAIEIPQGESEVEATVIGTVHFIDPESLISGLFTTKSDVHSFGIFLLMLLVGKNLPVWWSFEERIHIRIREYIEQFKDNDEKLIDLTILQQVGMDEFRAIKDLALACSHPESAHRPEMIDVARRLHEIEKQVKKPSSPTVPSFK